MVMASNNYDETHKAATRPSVVMAMEDVVVVTETETETENQKQKKEEEANQMMPLLPRTKEFKEEGGGGCNECLYNIRNDSSNNDNDHGNGYNYNNSKRRRRDSFSNLLPRNIPTRVEYDGSSSSSINKEEEEGSRRNYLPTLKEAQKRAELVHSLQQQICKLEKELAANMKEEKAASLLDEKRKRHTACKYAICQHCNCDSKA